MRDAIIAGLTTAIFEDNLNLVNEDHDIDNGINMAANRILEALAAAGHDTGYANPIILPVATPVVAVSLTEVIAAAATDALNEHQSTADLYEDEFGNTTATLGACILTGQDGEDEDNCTTHAHEDADGFDPYANFTPYQIPAEADLPQVRNLVAAIAPLFGTAVYYRAADEDGNRVMDVVSPTAVKDVFTQTITGLTAACRQHISENRMYPRSAATLYATLGAILVDDLTTLSAFEPLTASLPTAKTLLRTRYGTARRLSFVPVADDASEIAAAARNLFVNNSPAI